MGLANWLWSLAFATKYYCNGLFWSNGSLSEFYCLLVVDCTRYRDVTVKEAEDGEAYGL